MRVSGALLAASLLAPLPALAAQEPPADSAIARRPARRILSWAELAGITALAGAAFSSDQSLRNRIADPHDRLGRTLSDLGNGLGDGAVVYPSLLAVAVGGRLLGKPGMQKTGTRALQSTLLAGAAALALKSVIGRQRPDASGHNAYVFRPFGIHDLSLPSGHAAVAFALATSLARETGDRWTDAAFFAAATLTAYSRMHDDKHWASDVILGAGIGILSARFVHRFQARVAVSPGGLGMSLAF
jgi:membrane-associated phospholipid phosphatase